MSIKLDISQAVKFHTTSLLMSQSTQNTVNITILGALNRDELNGSVNPVTVEDPGHEYGMNDLSFFFSDLNRSNLLDLKNA